MPDGSRVATKDGSTGAYLVADLHGSLALAEASGSTAVLDAIRYDGYGQTLDTHAVTGAISLDTKYQGRLDLSATDDPLYDLSARLYAPGIGTFTSLDSVMGSAQNPASLNRFLYAEANPTTFTDPTGHRVCEAYCEESAPRASETKHERAVGAKAGKQRQRRQTERTKDNDSRTVGGASPRTTGTVEVGDSHWVGSYLFAKGGKQNIRDSGLIGVSDEEIQRRARDPNLTPSERLRYLKEEKARKLRNVEKRSNFGASPTQATEVAILGIGGYLLYRGLRLLPSLLAPPTLIPNLLVP